MAATPSATQGYSLVKWVKGAHCCLLLLLFTAGLCQTLVGISGRSSDVILWHQELWVHQLICGCFRSTAPLMNLCSAVLPGSLLSTTPHLHNKIVSKCISLSAHAGVKKFSPWNLVGCLNQAGRPDPDMASQRHTAASAVSKAWCTGFLFCSSIPPPFPRFLRSVEPHKKLSGGIRMRNVPKELVHLKKNVQAYTKQQGCGNIAPVVQQNRFLQYIIMVIIVMF